MSRTYYPDTWVIVKITSDDYPDIYKILAGWYGGFAGSNSWKISSGITAVEEDTGTLHFLNYSGSTYICDPGAYGLSGMTNGVLASCEKQEGMTIEVMPRDFDVRKVLADD